MNPKHRQAVKRCINTPPRGIGLKTQSAFFQWIDKTAARYEARGFPVPSIMDHLMAIRLLGPGDGAESLGDNPGEVLFPALAALGSAPANTSTEEADFDMRGFDDHQLHEELAADCPLARPELRKLAPFALLMWRLVEASGRRDECAPQTADVLRALLRDVRMNEYVLALSSADEGGAARAENLEGLVSSAVSFESDPSVFPHMNSSPEDSGGGDDDCCPQSTRERMRKFLDCMALDSDGPEGHERGGSEGGGEEDPQSIPVELMTIHRSKGLEFNAVVLCGVEDGVLPLSGADVEEERRLAYVAATRAKDLLVVTYKKTRPQTSSSGKLYTRKLKVSPFLEPLRALDKNCCRWLNS